MPLPCQHYLLYFDDTSELYIPAKKVHAAPSEDMDDWTAIVKFVL